MDNVPSVGGKNASLGEMYQVGLLGANVAPCAVSGLVCGVRRNRPHALSTPPGSNRPALPSVCNTCCRWGTWPLPTLFPIRHWARLIDHARHGRTPIPPSRP